MSRGGGGFRGGGRGGGRGGSFSSLHSGPNAVQVDYESLAKAPPPMLFPPFPVESMNPFKEGGILLDANEEGEGIVLKSKTAPIIKSIPPFNPETNLLWSTILASYVDVSSSNTAGTSTFFPRELLGTRGATIGGKSSANDSSALQHIQWAKLSREESSTSSSSAVQRSGVLEEGDDDITLEEDIYAESEEGDNDYLIDHYDDEHDAFSDDG